MTARVRAWIKAMKGEQGTSTIELALILPILMTIGFGVFEFGNMLYRWHLIQNGVRDGARYVAGLPYDPANTTQVTNQRTATQNIATTGAVSGGTRRVSWWAPADVAVSYATVANGPTSCGTTRCYRGGDSLYLVTVSTAVTYQQVGLLSFLGVSSITLRSSHEERVFGVR